MINQKGGQQLFLEQIIPGAISRVDASAWQDSATVRYPQMQVIEFACLSLVLPESCITSLRGKATYLGPMDSGVCRDGGESALSDWQLLLLSDTL